MHTLRPPQPPVKTLSEIADHLHCQLAPAEQKTVLVTGLALASDQVQAGDLFAALPGSRTHGAIYAEQAKAAGAVAILTDQAGAACLAGGVPVLVVPQPRQTLAELAAWFYNYPARHLVLAAVTGTTGKTTTTFLLHAAMTEAWGQAALLGTIGSRIGEHQLPQHRTTMEAPELQAALATMQQTGIRGCAMEVSSHALTQYRVQGLAARLAAFTNLQRDHLDYHHDMDAYFAAKAALFTPTMAERGVVMVDDPWGCQLAGLAETTKIRAEIPICTLGRSQQADWQWRSGDVQVVDGQPVQSFSLSGPNQRLINGQTQLLGAFNQANAALALLMAVELGIDPTVAAAGIARVKTVPGRLEIVKMPDGDNGPLAVVDFAHTPDQITALTSALRPVTKGRLILVIGAGGLRDQGKRPQMGAAAARGADIVLITDDNPRDEDPAEIRAALLAGARRHPTAQVLEIPGRQQAVTKAVALAQGGDTLVLAGKGHETSQEIAGQQQKWDDRQALSKALQEHGPWT